MRVHAQHHNVLRNHIEWHNDRLSHQTRGTACKNRFRLVSAASMREEVPHALVGADVEHAGDDLKRGDPEAAVEAAHAFRLVDFAAAVDHSFVHVALELYLKLGLYDCQWEQHASNGK